MKKSLLKIVALSIIHFVFLCKLVSQQNHTDAWWRHTTIYQIYPRSFMDSNGDGIGDIQGIISKLDYIRDLGFETIWISPFFCSPQHDFGYDISDYYSVDSVYGNLQEVKQLIAEIHQRKMYVVFDLVLNHTSDQHPWFKASAEKKDHKEDWYIWKKGKKKKRPNNWKSLTGPKGWHYNETRKEWYWSSFLPFQPDLNWRSPDVKKEMFNMVRFWLNKGVDGFRLDIFNVIYEDKDLRNNPIKLNPFPNDNNPSAGFQKLKYSMNQADNYQLAKELRELIDEYQHPKRFIIGEVFGRHEEIKNFLGTQNDGLNLIFLFDMKRFKFSAKFFRGQLNKYENYYHKPYVPVYVYSNHDDRRSMSRIDGSVEKAKLLAMFQLMARGVAVTYQGEEIGMTDTQIKRKSAKDPLAQIYKLPQFIVDKLPLLINRDECRTPMQWDTNPNAGFSPSNVNTWLPVNNNFYNVNVSMALNDSNSLIYSYKKLLELRKELKSLKYGDIEVINEPWLPKKVLGFKRKFGMEETLILLNFSKKVHAFTIPKDFTQIIFNTGAELQNQISSNKIQPYQGIILIKN